MSKEKERHTTYTIGPVSRLRLREELERVWQSGRAGRIALREEVGKVLYDYYEKILGPEPGTDYSRGVGTPILCQNPEGGPVYFLFTGWKTANAADRRIFIGEIDEAFTVRNIRKLVDVGEPSPDIAYHHTPSVIWDAYNEQWLMMVASGKTTGERTVCLFRFTSDFTERVAEYSDVQLAGGTWQPIALSMFRKAGTDLLVTYVTHTPREMHMAFTSDFRQTLPTFNYSHRLIPDLSVAGGMSVGSGPEVHHSIPFRDLYISLVEMGRQSKWNIYPVYWYDYHVCGLIGADAVVQPFISDDVPNMGHPYLTWLPDRKINLFFARFPAWAPSFKHEIWVTPIRPGLLDISKQRLLVAVPWLEDSINANDYSVRFPFFGRKTIYFTSNVAGDLTIEVDPAGREDWMTLDTLSGITSAVYYATRSAYQARLRFSQAATVSAFILLEQKGGL